MKEGSVQQSKEFTQSEISYHNHNQNIHNHEDTSILQNVTLRKTISTNNSQQPQIHMEGYDHQKDHRIGWLEENIKCLSQEGKNYQI